ncbi:MAG: IclR family transcriptional regulator, partial [Thermodesulfobacteriota bacterium]
YIVELHKNMSPRYFINSLERGLIILTKFADRGKPIGLSELANLTDLSLPTVNRYLKTLRDLGYLLFDTDTKKYSLSPKFLSLGFSALNKMDIRTRTHPFLAELAHKHNVNSQLAVLDGLNILYLERIKGDFLVGLDHPIGSKLPAFCTALGRAILAYLDDNEKKKLIKKIKPAPLTPHTILDKSALIDEINKTKQRGYAINMQEVALGWANYAVPIFHGNVVEASMGVSFPLDFVDNNTFVNDIIKKLLKLSKEISIQG